MTNKKFGWDSVGLDFGNWDDEKLWVLNVPTTKMDIAELLWHFSVPFWPNDSGDRWTVTPWEAIHKEPGSTHEQAKIKKADLVYPIDILENKGKWLVLDGLHRLAKSYLQHQEKVTVRKIPRTRLPEILIDEPIELPGSVKDSL